MFVLVSPYPTNTPLGSSVSPLTVSGSSDRDVRYVNLYCGIFDNYKYVMKNSYQDINIVRIFPLL